jgi:hypothetical protein
VELRPAITTLGIDLAAPPVKTAGCLIDWHDMGTSLGVV